MSDVKVFVNVADLVDPDDPQSRTYREVNAAAGHAIPLGSLVEIIDDEGDVDGFGGVRLYVVHLGRDCDQTPLYWLSPEWPESPYERIRLGRRVGGFSEGSLRVIRMPRVEEARDA